NRRNLPNDSNMNNVPTKPPEEREELAHVDDAIIGRAVRWSLAALSVIVLVGVGTILWLRRAPAAPPSQVTKISAPVVPERSQAEIPVARFTDVTKPAGIAFVHNNGAYGEKLLPETMGGGVAFFDFDNDSHQD